MPTTLDEARQNVLSVVSGLGVDGVPLEKAVSFPRSEPALRSAGVLAQVLFIFIEATRPDLTQDPRHRTALVFKLLAYLSRTGRVSEPAIRAAVSDIAAIADMLVEDPKLITAPVNFAKVLARHRTFKADFLRAAEKHRNPVPIPPGVVPPRELIWAAPAGGYRLYELTHPWHLVMESHHLRHCAGQTAARVSVTDGHSIHQIPYWRAIAAGTSRVFSFASKNPICTLHVTLRPATLIEAQAKPHKTISPAEHYWENLLLAVEHLDTVFNGALHFKKPPVLRSWRPPPVEAQTVAGRFEAFLSQPRR